MLFGHQNDDNTQATDVIAPAASPVQNPLAVDPETGASLPVAPPPSPFVSTPPTLDDHVEDDTQTAPVVEEPLPLPEPPAEPTSPAVDEPKAPEPKIVPEPEEPDVQINETGDFSLPLPDTPELEAPVVPGADELLELKQQALSELSPLVGQLDQTPEERFRTTMMMIQSTDNQALVKDAYEAAHQIVDEKARAQALLDIINEINYFTQPKPAA